MANGRKPRRRLSTSRLMPIPWPQREFTFASPDDDEPGWVRHVLPPPRLPWEQPPARLALAFGSRQCCDCGGPVERKPGRGRTLHRCLECRGLDRDAWLDDED
jgi:hypothetical protein